MSVTAIPLMSRRQMLMATSAFALAGCGTETGTSTTIAQQAVTALQAVAAEITQVIPQLVSAGLGGNTLTSVQQIVVEIQAALSGVSTAMTQGQGQSLLVQIEGYINNLAPLILPFVSLIPGGSYIGLIVAALPAIEAVVGVIGSALSSLASSLATTAPALPASSRFKATITGNSQQYLNLLEQKAVGIRASHRLR